MMALVIKQVKVLDLYSGEMLNKHYCKVIRIVTASGRGYYRSEITVKIIFTDFQLYISQKLSQEAVIKALWPQ